MNKTQKIKYAARKTKRQRVKQWFKKVLLFPWRVIKAIWRFICRICRAIWNWLKSIDIVGMINLTLLVIIIVLFSLKNTPSGQSTVVVAFSPSTLIVSPRVLSFSKSSVPII